MGNMGNFMDDMYVCIDRWVDCGFGFCCIIYEERRVGSLYYSILVCFWRDGDFFKDF